MGKGETRVHQWSVKWTWIGSRCSGATSGSPKDQQLVGNGSVPAAEKPGWKPLLWRLIRTYVRPHSGGLPRWLQDELAALTQD